MLTNELVVARKTESDSVSDFESKRMSDHGAGFLGRILGVYEGQGELEKVLCLFPL